MFSNALAGIVYIAIFRGPQVGERVLIAGAAIIFVLLIVLFLSERLSGASNRLLAAAGALFLWLSILLLIVTGPLLLTSIFFQWPAKTTQWVSQVDSYLPNRPTRRILLGNYRVEAKGCESKSQALRATAPGYLDPSQGNAHGFDLEVTGHNKHGVRNFSIDGNTIRIEAYAVGTGSYEAVLGCVDPVGAAIDVKVFAYVK